ncbi:hypothetical protein GCM10025298_20020 [Natronobiforma cellulositropha]
MNDFAPVLDAETALPPEANWAVLGLAVVLTLAWLVYVYR